MWGHLFLHFLDEIQAPTSEHVRRMPQDLQSAALTRLARRQKIDEAMECIKQVRRTGNAVDLRSMKPLI